MCNRCHKYFCISHRDSQDHVCTGHPLANRNYNPPPPPSSNRKEVCPLCGASFSDVISLINHTESKHNNGGTKAEIPPPQRTSPPVARPYYPQQQQQQTPASVYSPDEVCPICSKRFRSTNELINHCETIHNSSNNNNYNIHTTPARATTATSSSSTQREVCDVCGKSFATINELIQHADQVHSHNSNNTGNNGGSERCPKCNASFRTPEELVDHYESSHNNCTTGSGCCVC